MLTDCISQSIDRLTGIPQRSSLNGQCTHETFPGTTQQSVINVPRTSWFNNWARKHFKRNGL